MGWRPYRKRTSLKKREEQRRRGGDAGGLRSIRANLDFEQLKLICGLPLLPSQHPRHLSTFLGISPASLSLPSGMTRPPTPSPSMNPPAKSGWLSGIPGGLPAVSLFSLSIVAYVAQVSYFDLEEDEEVDKPRRGRSKGHSGAQESGRSYADPYEGRSGGDDDLNFLRARRSQ